MVYLTKSGKPYFTKTLILESPLFGNLENAKTEVYIFTARPYLNMNCSCIIPKTLIDNRLKSNRFCKVCFCEATYIIGSIKSYMSQKLTPLVSKIKITLRFVELLLTVIMLTRASFKEYMICYRNNHFVKCD